MFRHLKNPILMYLYGRFFYIMESQEAIHRLQIIHRRRISSSCYHIQWTHVAHSDPSRFIHYIHVYYALMWLPGRVTYLIQLSMKEPNTLTLTVIILSENKLAKESPDSCLSKFEDQIAYIFTKALLIPSCFHQTHFQNCPHKHLKSILNRS